MTDGLLPTVTPLELALRVEQVKERIAAAGGDVDLVHVMAVTKGFGAWAIETAVAAGSTIVGENYAQELVAKGGALEPSVRSKAEVHFIGQLQTNKVRMLAGFVDVWQSVDRPSLVRELARRVPGARVLLQLDIADSPTQGGCHIATAADLLSMARDLGLDVAGVMAIGPQGSPDVVMAAFVRAVAFADKHELPIRSLGMSGDLELAVRAGSTMVRVGTALFGERPTR